MQCVDYVGICIDKIISEEIQLLFNSNCFDSFS